MVCMESIQAPVGWPTQSRQSQWSFIHNIVVWSTTLIRIHLMDKYRVCINADCPLLYILVRSMLFLWLSWQLRNGSCCPKFLLYYLFYTIIYASIPACSRSLSLLFFFFQINIYLWIIINLNSWFDKFFSYNIFKFFYTQNLVDPKTIKKIVQTLKEI